MYFPMIFTVVLGSFIVGCIVHACFEEQTDKVLQKVQDTYFKRIKRKRG